MLFRRMQRKLEHFQKIAHSVQVSRDSFKKQLRKTAMYCEELFSEYERTVAERDKLVSLLHETENENASIHFLGDTITQRVGHLKKQLKVRNLRYISIDVSLLLVLSILKYYSITVLRLYMRVPSNNWRWRRKI